MAIATSLMSGPVMRRLLRLERPRRLGDYQGTKVFLQPLHAVSRDGAIKELVRAAGAVADVSARVLEASLFPRDPGEAGPVPGGVAVRAAEVEGLAAPLVGVGVLRAAIEFDEPGRPAEFLFVVLTPKSPSPVHGKILGDLARTLKDAKLRGRAVTAADWREVLSGSNS
jgi:mannitol/fructose-specific phosphotransferase system IIA component (Ntr-type)